MLKILLSLFAFTFLFSAFSYAEFGGSPRSVTLTTTTITSTAIIGTGTSLNSYTLLRGSNIFSKGFIITNPNALYSIAFNYSGVTYTTTTDYGLIRYIDTPQIRQMSTPNGIYVNTTFTTVYSGALGNNVKVHYEGFK